MIGIVLYWLLLGLLAYIEAYRQKSEYAKAAMLDTDEATSDHSPTLF